MASHSCWLLMAIGYSFKDEDTGDDSYSRFCIEKQVYEKIQ